MQAYRTQINRKTRNISTPYGLFLARNSNGYSALCYRPSSVRLSAGVCPSFTRAGGSVKNG